MTNRDRLRQALYECGAFGEMWRSKDPLGMAAAALDARGCMAPALQIGQDVYVLDKQTGAIHHNVVSGIHVHGYEDEQKWYNVRFRDKKGHEHTRRYTFPKVGSVVFTSWEDADEARKTMEFMKREWGERE